MTRYAIQTQAKGDQFYVRSEITLDLRLHIALVVDVEPRDTFDTRQAAERWARKVARRDPSLPLTIVTV